LLWVGLHGKRIGMFCLPGFFLSWQGLAFPILKKTEKTSKIKIIYRQDELNGREIH
jgi:hypothetical protein